MISMNTIRTHLKTLLLLLVKNINQINKHSVYLAISVLQWFWNATQI